MKTIGILVFATVLFLAAPSFGKSAEEEFIELNGMLLKATAELTTSYEKNDEVALYSFNIEKKLDPINEKITAFKKLHPEYKSRFETSIAKANDLIEKINSRHASELETSADSSKDQCRLTLDMLRKTEKTFETGDGPPREQVQLVAELSQKTMKEHPECKEQVLEILKSIVKKADQRITKAKTGTKSVGQGKSGSYDEWFIAQGTGTQSGKHHTFVACVNGPKNVTSIECNVPGSAAKRVFYNTDSIKDQKMRKDWFSAINEYKCVTAYVTAHEAFVVEVKDPSACR